MNLSYLLQNPIFRRTVIPILIAFSMILLIAGEARAALVTLDFDELSNNSSLDNQYAAQGVVFENDISLTASLPIPWPWSSTNVSDPIVIHAGSLWVQNSTYPARTGTTTATFSIPVDYVEVTMATFWTNYSYFMWLELYDSNNVLVAQEWKQNNGGGYPISATAPNVAYAKFWASGSYTSPYFDNFVFGTNTTESIPEPGTIFLVVSGILAAFVGRKAI